MIATLEQALIAKIRALSPREVAEVQDFVDVLASRSRKRAAFDRLLAIAPALEAAGAAPVTEDEIDADVQAPRRDRRGAGRPGAIRG